MKFLRDYPDLLKEFHPRKNPKLKKELVKSVKTPKIWWQCPKGDDHEWKQAVSDRVKFNNKCPFCSNRKLSNTNSLATVRPDLALEWHPSKNQEKTPNDYVHSTHRYVWWLCKEGHEWRTSIQFRSKGQSGCPDCALANFKVHRSTVEFGNTYSIDQAREEITDFMMENARIPTTSENLDIRKIYRRLTVEAFEPNGIATNWPQFITDCIKTIRDKKIRDKLTDDYQKLLYINRKNEWQGYGLEFKTKNQLKYRKPDLVSEIHPTLNFEGLTEQIHYKADTRIWWVCKLNHSFRMRVSARTLENQNCPICSYEDMASEPQSKPKYFWHTLYPAFYYAKKVITDFIITHNRVPASRENKNIHTIYRALRNPKVQKLWNVDNWSELLRITIGELDDTLGDYRDAAIQTYNELAIKLKHQGWISIIV